MSHDRGAAPGGPKGGAGRLRQTAEGFFFFCKRAGSSEIGKATHLWPHVGVMKAAATLESILGDRSSGTRMRGGSRDLRK